MHRAHLLVKQTFFFSITFKINYCQKQKCIILKNKKKKKINFRSFFFIKQL